MISEAKLQQKLEGYPEPVLEHYKAFLSENDPEHLTGFIVGIICFLMDASDASAGERLPDETDLQADLGVDSITIAEVVFLFEEIFEIEIDNHDLIEITTIGKMRQYVLGKLS